MVVYDDFAAYVRSAADNEAKILRIDAIITALEDSALNAAGKQSFEEYQLDDGQSRIRATYRSAKDIADAIFDFEQLRQIYINRVNPRVFRMVDLHSHTKH